ncbi:MAG: hypothetical protein PHI28_09320 [Mangrovibacterium sp.]|nr:hypothetical protein [Mangrovibacterium sp.]
MEAEVYRLSFYLWAMEDYLVAMWKTEGGRDQLVFSGQLIMEHTGEIKSRLMRLMSTFSASLDIVIKEVVDIDLSFLQLFHAFISLLKGLGFDVTVKWLIGEEQLQLLHGTGFSKWL